MALYRYLNDNEFLKYLNEDEIKIIDRCKKKEHYHSQQKIITLGDRNRDIFLIQSGKVAVQVAVGNNKLETVANLYENTIIGEGNFILPVRRSANVVAEGDVTLSRYEYFKLTALLKENPIIASKIFSSLNDGLVQKNLRTIAKFYEE